MEREILKRRAIEILNQNSINEAWTAPNPDLYPHQWNWDSAFISIGFARFAPVRAQKEILSLLRGQWKDGMVPHIVFNPNSTGYFPNPEIWKVPRHQIPSNVHTSGITQPPLLSYACWHIYNCTNDKKNALSFLSEVYKPLLAYHRFLYNKRDPEGEGLVFITHPWESGLDNSPRWIEILERIKPDHFPSYKRIDKTIVSAAQRPDDKEYNRYIFLIDLLRRNGYLWDKIFQKSPFLVQDVLFNSILQASNLSLQKIAKKMKRPNDEKEEINRWISKTFNAFNDKLWNEKKTYHQDYNIRDKKQIKQNTIAIFSPLFGRILDKKRAQQIIENHLLSPNEYWPKTHLKYMLTTTSRDNEYWNPELYWRGPIWMNTNWLLFRGLMEYGYEDLSSKILHHSIELVENAGFYEYFDPRNGSGCGINNFSWSAALVLDMLAN